MESNYVDLVDAAYNCDTVGTLTLLNMVLQGTSVKQRIGKKILMQSLQCRGSVANQGAAVSSSPAILIVYDRRPGPLLPDITDILQTVHSSSFNNDDNSARFRILKRDDFFLNGSPGTDTGNGQSGQEYSFFLNLKNLPVSFKTDSFGIDEGALYLITVGNRTPGITASHITAGFRLRFIDI